MIEITHLSQILPLMPYFELLNQRWSRAGLTQLLLIETAADYLNKYGYSSPFDGFIHDSLHQVFIGIAALNNREVQEVFIPEYLVKGELSFLQEDCYD